MTDACASREVQQFRRLYSVQTLNESLDRADVGSRLFEVGIDPGDEVFDLRLVETDGLSIRGEACCVFERGSQISEAFLDVIGHASTEGEVWPISPEERRWSDLDQQICIIPRP